MTGSIDRYPDGERVVVGNDVAARYLAACPHYRLVPKTPAENAIWRLKVRLGCQRSEVVRHAVWRMCEEDVLFFASTFCYIVEPRIGESVVGKAPFIPWVHQEPVLAAMGQEFGKRHLVGVKSRAQGASWMALMQLLHAFLFREHVFLGMGSRTQEDADDAQNPKSLGWKFDWMLSLLPEWMQPPGLGPDGDNRRLSRHTWINVLKNNYLKAEAATEGIGRGGRFTQFVLDECAFYPTGKDVEAVHNLLETTNSLVLISTPNGTNNEFYYRATNPGPWLTINLYWWDNPAQRAGLYTTERGQLKILDGSHFFGDDYPFVLDGKRRSPWYDRKCRDHGDNAILIAQELDGSFTGSMGRPFGEDLLEQVRKHCRPATLTGRFTFDPADLSSGEFLAAKGGEMHLWRSLDHRGRLPAGDYVIGCDVAAGTGGDTSSNSSICVFDALTCEQVAEWASHRVPPSDFAELAIALCRWLASDPQQLPFLVWEKNGPTGTAFTIRVVELAYPNVYRSTTGEEAKSYVKKSDRPGYMNMKMEYALTPLLNALSTGAVTMRSEACVREMGEYVYQNGKWVHAGGVASVDASSRGTSHGDRVVAAAMAVHGLKDRGALQYMRHDKPLLTQQAEVVTPLSMAGRFAAWQEQRRDRDAARSCVW